MKNKVCSRCKETKSLDTFNFYKDSKDSSGFRSECKVCTKNDQRLYYTRDVVRYNIYKRDAEKRGKNWELSLEDFIFIRLAPCYYCGEDRELSGVDRRDNNQGYTAKNSYPCCEWCNRMKWKYPENEFLKKCKMIVENSC